MTIAAGFRVHNGILVCADSQYSDGARKVFKPKVFRYDARKPSDCAVIFALSGSEANAVAGIEDCIEAIKTHGGPHAFSAIRRIFRETINEVHMQYVDSRPSE